MSGGEEREFDGLECLQNRFLLTRTTFSVEWFGVLQAQEARMQEEEGERLERARLEEILNMCAEYERQAQSERQQNKPPLTPTLHQNR